MPSTLRVMLLAAAVTAAAAEPDACPSSEWKQYEDMCYWNSNFRLQWDEVSRVCNEMFPGSTMVSIHDLDLNSFIAEDLTNYVETWLGLRRDSSYGSWTWTDGSPFDFNNWYGGDPAWSEEGCAVTNWNGLGDWTGYSCDSHLSTFACQIAAHNESIHQG